MGGLRALLLAAGHPERVDGVFLIGPTVPLLTPGPPQREGLGFEDEFDAYEGWAKYNRHYWLQDYRGFLEFFFSQVSPSRTRRSRSRTASPGAWTRRPRRSS